MNGAFGDTNDYEPGDYTPAGSCTGYRGADGPDVVYEFLLLAGEELSVTAQAANPAFDLSIYLLDACPPGEESCLAGSDEELTDSESPETLTFERSASESGLGYYFLVIDAYCSDIFDCPTSADTFSLTWSITP